ncbi:MAG: nickel-dependent lactate racemase [Candidatus Omnitrophica bacterium]|nr:nickel-dependent lactate racemase [Candidatus Omnitrophota bacterium]
MKTNRIKLPFEGRDIALDLPGTWEVLGELNPHPAPELKDIPASLTEGLKNPIGCKGLGSGGLSGKKIIIVVDDITRPTPTHLFFRVILKHLLDCGSRKAEISIIAAIGSHRDMSHEELKEKLGSRDFAGLKVIRHNCRDIGKNIKLGTTKRGTKVYLSRHLKDADLILCIGGIKPHPLLGFGGGLKIILPGLAYEKTIAQNHMQGVTSKTFNYIGTHDSPMRLDIEEAAQMLNKEIFIINTIMNQELKVCRFVCGDPIKAHREGIKIVESINARGITELADIAIAVSNPMNTDLRQGINCVANVEQSVKEGGLILALLECKERIGDIAMPPKPPPISYNLLRIILKVLGRKRILWFTDMVKRHVRVEERFLSHFSMQMARKNRIFIYSNNLPEDTGKRLGLFRQFTNIDEMLKAAAESTPKKARVYIYPHGGVTYPAIKRS